MTLSKIMQENQRLSMLHCLAAMTGYSTNHQIIQQVCRQYGNVMTGDLVKTHIAWMQEQGLLTAETMGDYMVATLTEKGLECEQGLAHVPGVKKAHPKF